MNIFKATVGIEVEIPVVLGTTTGLTLSMVDNVRFADGIAVVDLLDFEPDYSATFTEIHTVLLPGVYLLKFTPLRAGELYIKLVEGAHTFECVVQSSLAVPPFVADPSLEADYTVTVSVGATAIPGASVRVYNSAGTSLVTQGTTDSLGQVTFALEAGQYQIRIRKDGYDFSAQNPTTITVLPNDNVPPQIDELLPATGSIGDVVAILGKFFSEADSEVVFGTEATVPAEFVSSRGTALTVTVPAGITAVAIPIRVRKPDPDNVGQYLLSNVKTFVRV